MAVLRMIAMLLLVCAGAAARAEVLLSDARAVAEANPIRRVVGLLQEMQKEVQAEGEKEKELYDKFMCFCDGGTAEMTKAAEEAKLKMQDLTAQIEEMTAQKERTDQELVEHKKDREEAKATIAKATKIREKEHAAYAKEAGDSKANIDAISRAIPALEKGMSGGALLQADIDGVSIADRLKKLVLATETVDSYDRKDVLAFLAQASGQKVEYAPASGQIVGILKQMKDDMDNDLGGIVEVEEAAQKNFDELVAAKTAEIAAAGEAIEAKTKRTGDLAVAIVTAKTDLEDATAELSDSEKYAANLAVMCEAKTKEWNERSKTRSEEIAAIGEAISVLNDDDALDMFKKTLPTPGKPKSFDFLQVRHSKRAKAYAIVREAVQTFRSAQMDLIANMLKGRKVSFFKVIKMIDDMIVLMGEEQKDDDKQKAFCDTELDVSDDKRKELKTGIEAHRLHIEEQTESIGALNEEIATLTQKIKDLDQTVAKATEQRKEENADFVSSQAELNVAVELIEKAKNKLYKFYNPALYKPPPKRELTEEERIASNLGADVSLLQKTSFVRGGSKAAFLAKNSKKTSGKVAPPEAPETFEAGYKKKSGKSQGVIVLMDMLKKDLETEMTEAGKDEEAGQKDYAELMSDSATSRAEYVTSLQNDNKAVADLEGSRQEAKTDQKALKEELDGTKQYIADLHQNCDFLLENYDFRKTARQTERDALMNAKAALQGAEIEFVQTSGGRPLKK